MRNVFLVRLRRILILSLVVAAACTKAAPTQVIKVPPPPLPRIEQHAEPVASAISCELPKSAELTKLNAGDPVELTILEAQLQFERGENLYKQGFLQRAKQEFDGAVDLVLDAAQTFPKDPRL